MDQENDVGYYRRREEVARRLSAGSSDPTIRGLHADMAERYAAKVQQLTARPRLMLVT